MLLKPLTSRPMKLKQYVTLARKACDVAIHEVLNRMDFDVTPAEGTEPVAFRAPQQMRLLLERQQNYRAGKE